MSHHLKLRHDTKFQCGAELRDLGVYMGIYESRYKRAAYCIDHLCIGRYLAANTANDPTVEKNGVILKNVIAIEDTDIGNRCDHVEEIGQRTMTMHNARGE